MTTQEMRSEALRKMKGNRLHNLKVIEAVEGTTGVKLLELALLIGF